ncbi:hypothetical protein ANN_22783 [Periplaneta americana]|uniref:Uncharacterized protein n=1 Tax=Periplaneta americana TaxID=6978 RepID=A0ABQ8SL92_PERAM|nr:hypothetical protein ANN_22783 [Periplaneta americana]
MAGLCEDGNEPPVSLKAIYKCELKTNDAVGPSNTAMPLQRRYSGWIDPIPGEGGECPPPSRNYTCLNLYRYPRGDFIGYRNFAAYDVNMLLYLRTIRRKRKITYCSTYLASSVLVIIDAITSVAVNDDIFSNRWRSVRFVCYHNLFRTVFCAGKSYAGYLLSSVAYGAAERTERCPHFNSSSWKRQYFHRLVFLAPSDCLHTHVKTDSNATIAFRTDRLDTATCTHTLLSTDVHIRTDHVRYTLRYLHCFNVVSCPHPSDSALNGILIGTNGGLCEDGNEPPGSLKATERATHLLTQILRTNIYTERGCCRSVFRLFKENKKQNPRCVLCRKRIQHGDFSRS